MGFSPSQGMKGLRMAEAIVVNNVHKSYGNVKALDGVTFTAPKGKVLGLLGPNGAGKTTIVRILTTLLKPDSGEVSVAGIDVLKNPTLARQVFGLAGQYPAVDEQLTGRENLVMVGQLYHFSGREAKRRADELLERFTLTDAAKRPIKTYSGGMRRRLDLAASIVAKPQVLFLDEPTTGLDPRTRNDLWDVIRELVQDGTTLLLTTQYLEEADQLADTIAVMDKGAVIAKGTADELKAQLASDFIELRTENVQNTQRAITLLEPIAHKAPTTNSDNLITVPVDNGAYAIADVVRVLDGEGIAIGDLSLRRPSLDDVFLSLTGQEITEEETAPQPKQRRSA